MNSKGELKVTPLYNQEQVADIFGVHPTTVYRWRKQGKILATKVGKGVFFTLEEINRVIAENREQE